MIIALAIIGCLVGFLSGLLGIGGGIIIVPALNIYFHNRIYFNFNHLMHITVATSLTIIFFTAIITSFFYSKNEKINWSVFKTLCPGLVVGSVLGSYFSQWLHGEIYHQLFGGFLALIAIKVLFFSNSKSDTEQQIQLHPIFAVYAIFIGFISSILGISGGIIMTPLFFHLRMQTLYAIGTATVCTIPIVLSSSIVMMLLPSPEQVSGLIGYVYWPAVISICIFSMLLSPIGGKLAKILPDNILKRLLGILLIVSSIKMISL